MTITRSTTEVLIRIRVNVDATLEDVCIESTQAVHEFVALANTTKCGVSDSIASPVTSTCS